MLKSVKLKRICSLCICILLVAAVALFTTACSNNNVTSGNISSGNASNGNVSDGDSISQSISTYGIGENSFTFCVSDTEGKEQYFNISTDKTTVGEALSELGFIEGEEGPYGIYVKTVNGTTLDYETDGMYWAFYINTEMSATGADMTDIVNGEVYRFVATKG